MSPVVLLVRCLIITQDRERLSAELNEKMNAIGRHLDEIKNLKTQHDMLVKTNAATRVRLSVSGCIFPLPCEPVRALIMHHLYVRLSTRPRHPTAYKWCGKQGPVCGRYGHRQPWDADELVAIAAAVLRPSCSLSPLLSPLLLRSRCACLSSTLQLHVSA